MVRWRDYRHADHYNGTTLNIVNGNGHTLSGGILTNNGTVVDASGNYIRGNSWTIFNNGLWLEESDSAFYGDGGSDIS